MKIHFLFLTLLSLLFIESALAQAKKSTSQIKIDTSVAKFSEIEALVKNGGALLAIEELETILEEMPNSYHAIRMLGQSYLSLKQFELAEIQLEKQKKFKPKKPEPYLLFDLAYVQFRQGNFNESQKNLALFEGSRPPFNAEKWAEVKLIKLTISDKNLKGSEKSEFEMDTIFKFPNSGYADFSPIPIGDSLIVFSSLRQDSLVEHEQGTPNFKTIQMYKYKMRPDGSFDEIALIKNLNPPGYHNGNGSYSKDGKRFFFTRCTDEANGKLKCAIFESMVKPNGDFHKVKKLNSKINKGKYNSTQPFSTTVLINGQEKEVLFFVSNRRGGLGKNDIYFSFYNQKKNRFSAPLNAGFQINSPGNDESPFMTRKGSKLYYSSDGFPGKGGKDIFMAEASGINFSKRTALLAPINSMADESNFILAENEKSGFLASNRKGANLLDQKYCCEDIFRFQIPQDRPDVNALVSASEKTEPAILKEEPKIETQIPDIILNEQKSFEKTEVEELAKMDLNPDLTKPNLLIKPKGIGSVNPETSRKVFFAKNSATITKNLKLKLKNLMKEIKAQSPKEISVSGFADIKGNTEHNKKLAMKRAKSVLAYFKSNRLKSSIRLDQKDLKKANQTEDSEMLSLDRYVEIRWSKK